MDDTEYEVPLEPLYYDVDGFPHYEDPETPIWVWYVKQGF